MNAAWAREWAANCFSGKGEIHPIRLAGVYVRELGHLVSARVRR